jgi:hypothetical protein
MSVKPVLQISLLLCLICASCKTMKYARNAGDTLADQLTEAGYGKLFQYAGQVELHRLYDQHGQAAFERLAGDASATSLARLLACEVLYFQSQAPRLAVAAQALVYVAVLDAQSIGSANPWGTPRDPNILGQRIIRFGADAVPFLIDLLGNTTVLSYAGSREATSGNLYQYRIKDLAASLICAIRGVPYVFQQDFGGRDAWIAEHLGK